MRCKYLRSRLNAHFPQSVIPTLAKEKFKRDVGGLVRPGLFQEAEPGSGGRDQIHTPHWKVESSQSKHSAIPEGHNS